MPDTQFDVLAIGNAIVDVLVHADDALVEQHGLAKDSMTLIDEEQGDAIYATMPPGIECSGGSAANTIAGVASFGGRGAFIGKVKDDQLGRVFAHDLRAQGVTYPTPFAADGPATARSMIIVTPDAQRTMATYLGACAELGPEDLDLDAIANSSILYLEGYLWDPPNAIAAFLEAAETAKEAGRKVALSLSDKFCVERHHASFMALLDNEVDILFANEAEFLMLTDCEEFDAAVALMRGKCELMAVTRGAMGSILLARDEVIEIPVHPVDAVIDTTGAGDLYAAGFLFGLTQGLGLKECGALGGLAASEIISHLGARPAVNLRALARDALPALGLG